MIRRILAILIILAIMSLMRPAMAQYVMSTTLEPNAWIGPIDLSWQETVGGNTSYYTADGAAAGPQIISFVGAPPTNYPKSFIAYCVDLYHWDAAPNTVDIEPFTPISDLPDDNTASDGLTQAEFNNRLDQAAYLYDLYNPIVQSATGDTEKEDGAALQLAIWEIMAGPGSDFTFTNDGMNATIFSKVKGLTTTYYDSVGDNVGDGSLFQFDRNIPGKGGQNQLGPLVGPEGSSLVLLAAALLAPLALMAWRSRRRVRLQSLGPADV